MAVETLDVTKPDQMQGSLWVWRHDGVLYKCVGYDEPNGTYHFKGVIDESKEVSCLYSFLPAKMLFIKRG